MGEPPSSRKGLACPASFRRLNSPHSFLPDKADTGPQERSAHATFIHSAGAPES